MWQMGGRKGAHQHGSAVPDVRHRHHIIPTSLSIALLQLMAQNL